MFSITESLHCSVVQCAKTGLFELFDVSGHDNSCVAGVCNNKRNRCVHSLPRSHPQTSHRFGCNFTMFVPCTHLHMKRGCVCGVACASIIQKKHTVCLFTRTTLVDIFSLSVRMCTRPFILLWHITTMRSAPIPSLVHSIQLTCSCILCDASRCGEAQRNTHLDRFARSAGDSIRQYCPGRSRG